MLDLVEDSASKMRSADIDSLRGRLTSATCNFSQHLATQRGACLAQVWVPDSQANGPVMLHTQVGACRTPASDRKTLKLCMLFTRLSVHSATIRPHSPQLHGICAASSAQRMFHTPRQCCTVCHCCTFTPDILCSLLVNTAAYGMQLFPIARLADDCTCAHHRLFHSAVGMQGVPFSVAGCADLLALFRCVSCRYKFGTDTSKPVLMVSWFFAVLKIL